MEGSWLGTDYLAKNHGVFENSSSSEYGEESMHG
jgi:hypothetical protein